MPKFSEFFELRMSQRELDFVDVSTSYDTPVYVDPYAIEIRNDIWSAAASEHIRVFFTEVLTALRDGDSARAINLMSHFQEPSETFLGVSRGKPKGRGVGRAQARQLIAAIQNSNAFATGLLSDLSEVALYVEGIDRDKISDLTTNIIRFLLVDYTQEQCDLYGIQTERYNGPAGWNLERKNWEARYVQLPFIDGSPILLVPKYIVRRRLSLDSQEFYNKQITDFLVSEHINANSSLVQTIKSGKEKKVFKKDARAENPKSKSYIADLVRQHPELLDIYKELAKKGGSEASFLRDDATIHQVCRMLAQELVEIPTGKDAADRYHRFMMGAITALFYPNLIQPHKEWPINDGRKRVDIVYTNTSDHGFFSQRRDGNNTQASVVVVECKNYSSDISNQELDQMLGRFDDNRGKFGIVTCRSVDNPDLLLKRCRDMASRSMGFIIVLTDADILQMLRWKELLEDDRIDDLLHLKFRALLQ
jgi:hypothetical protein